MLGMLGFELLELAEQLIEFVIADLRRGVEVVQAVVPLELLAQALDLFLDILRGHAGLERYRERSTIFSAKFIAFRRASTRARNSRRPFTRLRLSATKRIPRGVSK